MRIENQIIAECLRCLRDAQPRAVRRAFDVSAGIKELDGVRNGNGGNCGARATECLDRAL
jgi:hypothetical protein